MPYRRYNQFSDATIGVVELSSFGSPSAGPSVVPQHRQRLVTVGSGIEDLYAFTGITVDTPPAASGHNPLLILGVG
jgi:hypothetical protein